MANGFIDLYKIRTVATKPRLAVRGWIWRIVNGPGSLVVSDLYYVAEHWCRARNMRVINKVGR